MHQVTIGRRRYQVPARWNELTADQLVRLAPLAFTSSPTLIVRARVLAILLDVRRRPRLFFEMWRLSAEDWATLRVCTDWFFQKLTLTKNLLPRIQEHFFDPVYYGPGDMFAFLTFEEFIESEGHYEAWRAGKVEALDQLVATLYRPEVEAPDQKRRHGGDLRAEFNPVYQSMRLTHVKTWPLGIRQAIGIYYDSCRARLVARYRNTIFHAAAGAGKSKPDPQRLAWLKTLRALAGSLTEFEKVAKMSLSTVMFDFEERILEQEAIKEKLKQQ